MLLLMLNQSFWPEQQLVQKSQFKKACQLLCSMAWACKHIDAGAAGLALKAVYLAWACNTNDMSVDSLFVRQTSLWAYLKCSFFHQ